MSKVSDCISKLRKKISEFSAYTTFISFEIGTTKFTTNSNDGYFMSMDHEKTGTGSANTFSIGLAYCPDPAGVSQLDISLIDFDVLISTKECRYKYGYIFPDGEILESPTYVGQVLDYTIQIQDAMILYTITGYSNLSILKDTKITKTKNELIELSMTSIGSKTYNKYSPIGLVMGLFQEYATNIDTMDKKYTIEDCTKSTVAVNDQIFTEIDDQFLFEYIKTTLMSARAESQKDQADDCENLITFEFMVDDSIDSGSPKVKIIEINPEEKDDASVEFVFDWMSGRLDDIVLNFAPDFKGSVAIATSKTALESSLGEGSEDKYALDSNGEMKEVIKSMYSGMCPTAGDSADIDIMASAALMALFSQNVYNGVLTTLGIPEDVPILTHFQLTPLIYGQPHHTEGEYYTTKQTDQINSAGYTSTFEITKVGGASVFKDRLKEAKVLEEVEEFIDENLKAPPAPEESSESGESKDSSEDNSEGESDGEA